MLDPVEAFLLRCRNKLTVNNKSGAGVAVLGVDPQYVHRGQLSEVNHETEVGNRTESEVRDRNAVINTEGRSRKSEVGKITKNRRSENTKRDCHSAVGDQKWAGIVNHAT